MSSLEGYDIIQTNLDITMSKEWLQQVSWIKKKINMAKGRLSKIQHMLHHNIQAHVTSGSWCCHHHVHTQISSVVTVEVSTHMTAPAHGYD